VVIFSKSYCGYCRATKNLFESLPGANDVQVHELDHLKQGDAIQQALYSMTGQTTVPSVYINGQHVGGNDAVQTAYRNKTLKSML
jgi:glutaredoxin 3